ncbi:MAG TPA: hypothetical protein VFP83_02610 [Candidatus Limnocylindria bacterium]|nr:hypothetical protein [Candidatus Limnocylindria bacterium]
MDLTGTWQVIGGEPFYFVHQDGDCIWIAGVFLSVEGERFNPILRGQTFGFDGHLLPDFTLQGRWVILDLPSRTRLSATGSWALDVEVDPWTLRGPPRDTPTGPVSLLLERVSDGFVSP